MPGDTVAEVCENPSIYMDPNSRVLPIEGRAEWYDVLERALAAKPSDRWASVEAMADALERVMQSAPISEFVHVSYPWGQHPTLVRTEEGEVQVGWVLLAPPDSGWT